MAAAAVSSAAAPYLSATWEMTFRRTPRNSLDKATRHPAVPRKIPMISKNTRGTTGNTLRTLWQKLVLTITQIAPVSRFRVDTFQGFIIPFGPACCIPPPPATPFSPYFLGNPTRRPRSKITIADFRTHFRRRRYILSNRATNRPGMSSHLPFICSYPQIPHARRPTPAIYRAGNENPIFNRDSAFWRSKSRCTRYQPAVCTVSLNCKERTAPR